jgi:raffinose/stachyose/melibiose transport system permease protein
MITNKGKERVNFALFLLPALIFYFLFVIIPFILGLWLSTMNWDGTAPWSPAQMPIAEFEEQILGKIKKLSDKELVLKYYIKNEDQGTYQKQELYGIDRYRVQIIIAVAGYVNQNFKFIGFENYIGIFTGKIDQRFFPERYREAKFNQGSPMDEALKIPESEWKNNIVSHIKNSPEKLKYLNSVYKISGQERILDREIFGQSEMDIQIVLSGIPGFEDGWEDFYDKLNSAGINGNENEVAEIIHDASAKIKFTQKDFSTIKDAAAKIYAIGYLKGVLNEYWYKDRFKMGVLLFTLYFTALNVLLVNILAIFLALGLDTKIKSRNILRSVYFIPNIMSMIIVAFIWQLVFTQLLPKITGIQSWIMNPSLAPTLTVFVAVWQGLGYYTIIYLAGLQSISTEILEVSAIDGIPFFQRLFRIVLPLILPAVSVCLFLSLAGSLKTFDIIFALYPSNSTSMGVDNLVVNIFYDAFRDKHASLASAKAILLLITVMVITGLQLYFTKKKEVEL